MKSLQQIHEEHITSLLNGMSGWMESCIGCNMSLEEFTRRFNKFVLERKEGLDRERKENYAIKSN